MSDQKGAQVIDLMAALRASLAKRQAEIDAKGPLGHGGPDHKQPVPSCDYCRQAKEEGER